MKDFIIASCRLCGMGSTQVDSETLICRNCLVCRRRENAQMNMSEIADVAGGLCGFIQGTIPSAEHQVKALLYASSALITSNKIDLEQMKIFLNCCVYEFEQVNEHTHNA